MHQEKCTESIYVPLNSIAEINPDTMSRNYPFNEINYIDISSVGSGILLEEKRIPLKDAPSRAKRLVVANDIILSTVRPNRRSFLYMKSPSPETVVSTGFAVLRAKKGIDPRYLYYCITHQSFTDYLSNNAKGAAYPAVDTEIVSKGQIPLYDFETQRKIASILSAYDDLIENNLRRIKILEEMAQRIYREWFVKFRFPGHENVPLVDSPLGKIPKGWEVKPISEVLSYNIGGGWGKQEPDKKYKSPAYVIRGTDIPSMRYVNTSCLPYRFHSKSNLETRKLQKEDLIFEVSGGSKDQPLGRVLLIGEAILRQVKGDVICASFCKLLRPNSKVISPYYLYMHLREIYDDGRIKKYEVQSTGISNLRYSYFAENEIIIIPIAQLLEIFNEKISALFDLIGILGIKNQNLRKTRDMLLPKLISGDLDISEIDIKKD